MSVFDRRHIIAWRVLVLLVFLAIQGLAFSGAARAWSLPDTGQTRCYSDSREIACPKEGDAYYGQDAQYSRDGLRYRDNGDGTVTDLVTGLMWQQTPGEKVSYMDAFAGARELRLAGYDDWRMPTIKELYSLMDFNGVSPGRDGGGTPYIDTGYFDFEYGDTSKGERSIDAQYWSANKYVSTTIMDSPTAFGVNFADGRIKGYPTTSRGNREGRFARYVRAGDGRMENDFVDNGDGTVTDRATGLMWMKVDSGSLLGGDGGMDWEHALAWAENLEYAGYSDWRLPDAKELQFIVDYTRSPDTTSSAAIDPIFETTAIKDEGGGVNYPFFWTSTTHLDGKPSGSQAVYIAFGEALGFFTPGPPQDSGSSGPPPRPSRPHTNMGNMNRPSGNGPPAQQQSRASSGTLTDVHGAGAQRSDPKSFSVSHSETSRGPQGDVVRVENYVRCVRNAD